MDFEREENKLRSVLQDVLENTSYEASFREESDHCGEHDLQSDIEQEISDLDEAEIIENSADSDDSEDNISLSVLSKRRRPTLQASAPHYKSKDSQKWYKSLLRTNVRTRSENKIVCATWLLSGVKGAAREAHGEVQCWNIFITKEIKAIIILKHTNEEIIIQKIIQYEGNNTLRVRLDAFIGLLYLR